MTALGGATPPAAGAPVAGRLKRWVRHTGWVLGILIIVKSVAFQWMVASGGTETSYGSDLQLRRGYLIRRVATAEFGPADMPSFVSSPYREELAISTLSMTTVALTNLSFTDPRTRIESRNAVRTMLSRMLSNPIRRYDVMWWGEDAITSLAGPNGHIGYLGHLNLMLGCYFLLGGQDPGMRDLLEEVSASLSRRLTAHGTYHAESFPHWTYTADNVIAVLSLRVHDLVSKPAYASLIQNWLEYSKQHLVEPDTGMLRYHVSPSGQPLGTARGVLQAWNSMWLPLINESFGRDQYQRMRQHLLAHAPFGDFAAIREYGIGRSGPTDLVSGPLILGLSPTATGFALGGAALWHDAPVQRNLLRTAEAIGTTISLGEGRHYLLAPLAGDAIMLAARTMTRWDRRFIAHDFPSRP